MKVTLIRKENAAEIWSVCDVEAWMDKLKRENKDRYISQLRKALPYMEGERGTFIYMDRIPRVYPAVEYRRTSENGRKFKSYNGIVQLEVNRLSGRSETEHVKERATLLPQTFAAFTGSSGRSVKIWVRFSLPDGSLPATKEQAALFHAHAYRMAVKCYQSMFPYAITLKEPILEQSCRMSVDERPYYNPDAVAFILEQPLTMPDERTYREQCQSESNPILRMERGVETYITIGMMYEAVLKKIFLSLEDWKRGDDLLPVLIMIGEECFRSGIPEEEAVWRTNRHFYYYESEPLIRATLHNLYMELKGFGIRSALTKEQETTILMEEFLKRRYEFRFNTLTDDLEYRIRDSVHFYFKPVDKRVRNSIAIHALKEGIRVWDRDVDRFLTSDYVPLYHPMEEFLCKVGNWDGRDRIRELADAVPCNHPHWRDLFYRWFLSMVAHWQGLDKNHGNATTPILVGAQGYRKSTFCRILLPPELRFGYTDSLNFSSKIEAERCLGRFFLINLDEFDQISVNQQGFLKHLLQKPVANLRKPYGTSIREMRRYASFIATSNRKDLLTDLSGNRRFICVEVTAPIDTNMAIDYRQLYAQAMEAVRSGERYWLDDAEEAILKESNKEFEAMNPLEQLFHACFRPAEEAEGGRWYTAMEIFHVLQTQTKDRLPVGKVVILGRLLQKMNIPNKKSSRGNLYCLLRNHSE